MRLADHHSMSRTLPACPSIPTRRVALLAAAVGAAGFALAAASPAAAHHDNRPHEPRNLRVLFSTSTSITIAWYGTAHRFHVSKDRLRTATTTRTRYTYKDLKCGTAHRLGVRAVDRRGRRSKAAVRWVRTRPCAPQSTQIPEIHGPTQEGEPLFATTGAWHGATPMTYTYRWLRCDVVAANCSPIADAFAGEYTPSLADVGWMLRAQVEASNAFGFELATSRPAGPVLAVDAPPLPGEDPPPPPPEDPDPGRSVSLVDQSFSCRGPVDLDLLRVTLTAGTPATNAVELDAGCTGVIRRIEVWAQNGSDGIKIRPGAGGAGARNLQILGGFVRVGGSSANHTDGLQAGAGTSIDIRNVAFMAGQPGGGGNAAFFIAGWNGGNPTNVVCTHCAFGPYDPLADATSRAVMIADPATNSGTRDSRICEMRYFATTYQSGGDHVDEGNTVVSKSNPDYASFCSQTGLLAYVASAP